MAVDDRDLIVISIEHSVVSSGLKKEKLDAQTSRHVEVLDNSITMNYIPFIFIG